MDRQISCPESAVRDPHPVDGAQPRFHRWSRCVKTSLADFFGVGEENDKLNQKWKNRRLRYCSSVGKIKDEYVSKVTDQDEVDFPKHLFLRRTQKDSVLKMTWNGLTSVSLTRKKLHPKLFIHNRSYAPGSLFEDERNYQVEDVSSLVDDVFFDEPVPDVECAKLNKIDDGTDVEQRLPPKGWRRTPPQPLASEYDEVDIGLSRIKKIVIDSTLEKEKRHPGIGFLGQMMHQRFRSDRLTSEVKQQIDEIDDHRPYFTYWVTFVQIIVFLVSVAVYGIAPVGVLEKVYSESILMPNLGIEFKRFIVSENMWVGPLQADLIHLGAKYSPCMRRDENIEKALKVDRSLEQGSACCVRNDGSGCAQMTEKRCSKTLSTFEKLTPNKSTGTVCGQDPKYCIKPASQEPFKWDEDITKWPICEDSIKPNQSKASLKDRHMTCDLIARPCCHGIQGECFVTTQQHCNFIRGYFHEEATLCSQVNCMSQICGMIPFYNPEQPDQFYRLWTSLFLHGGLFHLIISVLFQLFIMRDVEKLTGCIRTAFIYMGSGIGGNIASSIFLPYHVEAGPAGSQFGILACLLIEVVQNWQMLEKPWRSVFKFAFIILLLFVLGLFPWIDNWAHLIGFFIGILLAFVFLPYVTFGKFDKRRKLIGIFICFGSFVVLISTLMIFFYVFPVYNCPGCQYFNCIPFGDPLFCKNMEVTIRRMSRYEDF